MTTGTPFASIRRLQAVDESQIGQLASLLIDCVEGGASVSFMLPLSRERAMAFWRRVAEGVAAGHRALLVAEDAGGLCGTVQLILDLPENQPHRADLAKMLVHRRARRQGVGAALMQAAEAMALDCGRSLLVLDAVTGGDAERLYARLGWQRVGVIPRYALMPDGAPCSTTVFYRELGQGDRRDVADLTVTIRLGTTADAARLAEFAARTFRDTFGADNSVEDMDAYLAETYRLDLQGAELADEGMTTLLAEDGDGFAAFAQVRHHEAPPCVSGPAPIELWRFYVDRRWHGRGLAQRLMRAVQTEARARGARTLWLGVWEHNVRAQAFYLKCGFVDVGSQSFVLGNDPQTDRIMARSIAD